MALQKSWQWVGAFGAELTLCVAQASVGPIGRSWWAVWDGELREGARGVRVLPGRASVRGELDLALAHGTAIEVTTGPAWTRKTPLRVTGTVGGRSIDLPGLLDESAGRHARRTAWRWAAGAGVAESGADVVFNLVEGLHDGSPSERRVWVDGVPHEVPYQPFDGLDGVGDLRFVTHAVRAKRENYLVIASDYEQPFGTFEGSLPVAGPLHGWGVMERHEALW
jgi:Protein of unknown function (DUF2804)